MSLPPDSILRKLPQALPMRQRLEIETLVFSADAATIALNRILGAIQTPEVEAPGPSFIAGIFSDAWSIVDRVHAARQIMTQMRKHGNEGVAPFIAKYRCAKALRDKMDHLADQIPNRAATKGLVTPLNGIIGFLLAGVPSAYEITSYSIPSGSHNDQVVSNTISLAGPIEVPIGNLELTAFDSTIRLVECVRDLQLLLLKLESEFEATFRASVERQLPESDWAAAMAPRFALATVKLVMRSETPLDAPILEQVRMTE